MPKPAFQQDRVEGAFDHTLFHIDWKRRQVTYPNGKTSICCLERRTWRGIPNLTFVFDKEVYLPCPVRNVELPRFGGHMGAWGLWGMSIKGFIPVG